jgi:protein-S-isoprenylcysteine O-methyltransferase Ste14
LDIRQFFFKNRGITPVPLMLAALVLASPSTASFLAGAAIVLAGEAVRFWGVAYAGVTTRTTSVGANKLVTDGPYRYVRNPLYIGNFLMSLGWTVMAWPWMPWMLLVVLVFFSVQYSCIVDLEEEFLSGKFGAEYDDFRKRVPRWIPRLTPDPGAGKITPEWRRALRSERNTLQAVGVIAILIWIRWKVLG